MALDLSQDYLIWDVPEAVTLIQVATSGNTEISVSAALRLPLTTREMAASNGAYTSQDCMWLLPGPLLTAAQSPRPGWRIQAANEYGDTVDWTILDRSYSTLTDTFNCTCRDLVLVADLRDSISVYRPSNTQTSSAFRIPGYAAVYSSIPGKIQEQGSEPSEAHGRQTTKKVYIAYLGQRLTLTIEDYFYVGSTTYQVKGWRNPDRIDQLQEVDLEILT